MEGSEQIGAWLDVMNVISANLCEQAQCMDEQSALIEAGSTTLFDEAVSPHGNEPAQALSRLSASIRLLDTAAIKLRRSLAYRHARSSGIVVDPPEAQSE